MLITIFQVLIIGILIITIKRPANSISIPMSRDNTEYLRGIAIFMVIAHYVSNNLDTRILTPWGGIGVAIFLIISGFGLNESFKKKGLHGYWSNKIIRVLIPCWIVEIIWGIINIKTFNLGYFIRSLLCIEINWYIRYLVYLYVIFYITSRFITKYRLLVMGICALLMLFTLPEIEAEQSFSFVGGICLSAFPSVLDLCKKHTFLLGSILGVIGILALGLKQIPIIRGFEKSFVYSIIQMFIKLPSGLAIIVFSWKLLNPRKKYIFLGWLGTISYELYLIHCKLLFYCNVLGIIVFYLITFILAFLLFKLDNLISTKYKSHYKI